MKNSIKTIAFDADDTLWINETYFQEAEQQFCTLLENYLPGDSISQEPLETELKNLHLYGYGVKGFVWCMIETASRVSAGTVPLKIVDDILTIGQEHLEKPIELLQVLRKLWSS